MANVDKMVFAFQDEHSRNTAGRVARAAGYECSGSKRSAADATFLLTIDEPISQRRSAVDELVRHAAPGVDRIR